MHGLGLRPGERGSGMLQFAEDTAKSRNVGIHNRARMKDICFLYLREIQKELSLSYRITNLN